MERLMTNSQVNDKIEEMNQSLRNALNNADQLESEMRRRLHKAEKAIINATDIDDAEKALEQYKEYSKLLEHLNATINAIHNSIIY